MGEYVPIGTGLTVFEHDEPVEGPVVWLDSPAAVMDFVRTGDIAETIVLARGGTTTFLTPALSAGVKGVMTLQGAPESHLGILSREYGIPALMSVAFTEGVRSSRGEIIPPDGAIVRIDLSQFPQGSVAIDPAARTYDSDGGDAEVEPDPEAAAQAEQMAALMASYRGELADGTTGDRQLRARMGTTILDTDAANIAGDLRDEEIDDFLSYVGWNLWDLIKARQTEGESGLIPRQEYETVSFVQQWGTYGRCYDMITEKIGVDGMIDLGRIPRDEIGSKANHVHIWAAGSCPLIGKALAAQLGVTSGLDDRANANTIIQATRRLQHGLLGDGPGYVSGRNYQVPVLADHWIERFRDEEHRFADADDLAAFRRFNAATELAGFLLHYDCRAGLCDTGPYPLPDGGFVIVRDHFLNETAYEWAGVMEGLPYAVTEAMFFRPDTPVDIRINDIATTFAQPRNYLKYLSGVAVYARDAWDTPMSAIRRVDRAEMDRIVTRCNKAMLDLYEVIGALPWDERIRNGVKVYTRDMMLPWARPAGLWDTMLAEGFDHFAPITEQAYPTLSTGGAPQVLGAVFLMGQGLVPEAGLPPAPPVPDDALTTLHAVAMAGSHPAPPADADRLVGVGLLEITRAGHMLTEAGRSVHEELLSSERAGLDLDRLGQVYDRFLALNGSMKGHIARAGSTTDDGALVELTGEVAEVIERVEPVLERTESVVPRFAPYRGRLRAALQKVEDGEWSYLGSPAVDSVHTVWMECHEDFLQTLGRSREDEGSY
ncbi:PEP-utilizing enzyme [Actinomycetospora sp.]|jgi:hypothetical protein|uniref:PEP-utilizing enzyme n=1 Tax=Actinomycetospora sp. TaxID=1872135 RepID=UPI002F428FB8